jgi:hypothetical protein
MPVIINGTTGIDTVQDGIVTDAKLNLTANSQEIKDALNATGSADIYACRAWVNFNGTGTVAIRASGNVSSITDNGTGDYTVNFTNAMPDVNFSFIGICSLESGTVRVASITDDTLNKARTTNSFSVLTKDVNSGVVAAVFDPEYVNIAVFR